MPTASSGLTYRLLTVVFLLTILLTLLFDPLRIGHDQAAALQVGDLLAHRSTLYVDVIDLNPPLLYYLHAGPAAIARRLGVHPVTTFLIVVWLFTVWSAMSTRHFLARAIGDGPGPDLVAASIAWFSIYVLWRNEVGQRQHLFVLGLLPYLAVRFVRAEGGRPAPAQAAFARIVAAVLACLKPSFMAVALAPEAYWFAIRRPLRASVPEFAASS